MKTIHRLSLLLSLALGLTAGSSYGTTFTYSYTFGDGHVVSGKLDGTENGNFVENVSHVSMFFDGFSVPGTIHTSMYDGANYQNGPVVSFDALQNNFLFATSDLAAGDLGYESLFYILNASVFDDTAVAFSSAGSGFASQDSPTSGRSWSLHVPETGSTIAFIGLALVGLAWVRRKSATGTRGNCLETGRAVTLA